MKPQLCTRTGAQMAQSHGLALKPSAGELVVSQTVSVQKPSAGELVVSQTVSVQMR